MLENLDSTWSRTVHCDWARGDWREDDGVIDESLDQDAFDNILFMAEQYFGRTAERGDLEADANTHGLTVWIDALELLNGIGVVEVFERKVISVALEEANRLARTGQPSPLHDPQKYPALRARVINFDHMNRRYPPRKHG